MPPAARKALIAIFVAGCARAAAAPPAVPPPRADGRLPREVRPSRYALDLVVDPAKTTFTGRARIGVAVEKPVRAIVMHGRGLAIRKATLQAGKRSLAARTELRMAAGSKGEPEELVLSFEHPIPKGDATIEIDYEAPFADGLRGLYRVTEGGASYAYTQFEPNDARLAFPCFDEPGWKTPFELAITVPKGALAFANMPEQTRRPAAGGDLVRFEFDRSPPMPTYLVAFAVGPFDVLAGPERPVPARLIATKGKAALGRLALDTAVAHLELLGKYFDRPYPYPKLDIVAVPSFGAGAMENPGLVTFREELLLLDPAGASTAARRAMAGVIAHELAHQWFGDLVTMAWWDDLWLNEAFASFMGDKIVDEWRPETRARLQALAGKSQVMGEDSLATARRIRNPVRSTGEALEAFDGITYAKGRAVLAMVEAWLGEDRFRAGLQLYLRRHEWGNATASDLYTALAEASDVPEVPAVMNSFTDQTGAPALASSLTCGPAGASLVLSQREYLTLERERARQEVSPKLWQIPVCVFHQTGTVTGTRCGLLAAQAGQFDLGGAEPTRCPGLVYPNAGEAGYYRVRLGHRELGELRPVLAAGRLPEPERFGVVSNAWAAVWSGDLPASDALDLFRGFGAEESRLVWGPIMDALYAADRALVTDAARPAFARFVRALLGPAARRLGFAVGARDSDETKLLREAVLGTLGGLGDDGWALDEAARTARAWLADQQAVSADLARIALPLAAKHGDGALFDRLVGVLRAARTPEIRLLALSGLTSFDDPKLVARTLGLTLDGTIKTQDLRYVLPGIGMRRATRDVVYAWIQQHFDDLARVFPKFLIGRITRVTAALCDRTRVRDAEAFFRPRVASIEGTEKDMRQAVEEGLRCAALADKERAPTSEWLARAR
jgi:alanyl aminopeptidase